MTESPMTASWTLQLARNDLWHTRMIDTPLPTLEPGEALLRVDRVDERGFREGNVLQL